MRKKQYHLFVAALLLSQLFLAACTSLIPMTAQPTQTEYVRPTARPTATLEPTEIVKPSATPIPAIAITNSQLRGLGITVRHPFVENTAEFDQLLRDFNLNNLWGIHVSGVASGGTEGLKYDLLDGKVHDNLVIGMGYDLLAAQPETQFLAVQDFARDARFGVTGYFDPESPSAEISPQFGDMVTYTIPLAYNAGILLYNSTWAQELGFNSLPADREDLRNVAQAAMEANLADGDDSNNGTGGLWLAQSPQSAISWYGSFLTEMQDPGFSPLPEPLLASFYFLRETFDASQSWIGVEPLPYRYFSDRYAIAVEGTLESLRYQAAYQSSGSLKDGWTAIAYPGNSNSGNPMVVIEPLSFAVQRSNPNAELAAWIFGIWLLEPAQQARLVQMHGLWPSTGDPATIAPGYASAQPYWAAALEDNPTILVVPNTAEWVSKRLVFQDAYSRIYNLDAEFFVSIVDVFDETTRINLEQQP